MPVGFARCFVLLASIGCAGSSDRVAALPERPCAYAEHVLRLPYPNGASYSVLQGNDGAFSHRGFDRFAWDFAMPVGSLIVAAEDGVVAEVIDEHEAGGRDPALRDRVNVIVVDHGDAHYSVYQHLAHRGALVREGDVVRRGQRIARSGNTGFSSAPHLHFEVIDHRNRSLPVCFAGSDRVPRQGAAYVAREVHAVARRAAASLLPRDTFVENGILLEDDLPARRFTNAELELRGRATQPASEAVVFLMTRDTSALVRHVRARVAEDGSFTMRLRLSGLDGPLDLAMALAAEPDGAFQSRFSVPVVVRSP